MQTKPQSLLIVGCPRSGTTILQQLIGTCFEGVHIPYPFERQPTEHFWEKEVPADAQAVIFKQPELPWSSPELFAQFQRDNAKIIGIIRDVRSLLTSKIGGKGYYSEVHKDHVHPPLDRWTTMAWILDGMRRQDANFELVRFEDLLCDPERVQADLRAFLGYDAVCDFADAHKQMTPEDAAKGTMNGVRPLDPARATQASDEELAAMGFTLNVEVQELRMRFGYREESRQA